MGHLSAARSILLFEASSRLPLHGPYSIPTVAPPSSEEYQFNLSLKSSLFCF